MLFQNFVGNWSSAH